MNTTAGVARAFAGALLVAAGMRPSDAGAVAEVLVTADVWGRGSHGLLRLPYYLRRFAAGGADPAARLTSVRDAGAVVCFDGGNGIGHAQCLHAADVAVERARQHGIGAVAVGNSGHCGVLGIYVHRIASAGMVGFAFSNGPAVMPPWGGRRAVVSTSPLAVGFPAGARPLVVDLAASAVSRGKIAEAAARGSELEPGWALDADGRPTRDPQQALAGMLAPFGGAKGWVIALLVEMLTGGLVGPHLSRDVADPLSAAAEGAPQRIAHLVLALDGSLLDVDGLADERVASLLTSVTEAGGRVPGERYPLAGEITDAHAVAIADAVGLALVREAERLAVAVPAGFSL